MSFVSEFRLSADAEPGTAPMADALVAPGVYEDGVITVLDSDLSRTVARSWEWLLGKDAVALATTAFGDLFFWSERHNGVFFLESQTGRTTFVDREIGYFYDKFLTQGGVRQDILRAGKTRSLNERLGALLYGECYIAEPWEMLGGTAELANFIRGRVDVYLDLTAQAVHQLMDIKRRSK